MTQQDAITFLPFIQALAAGKPLQYRGGITGDWYEAKNPSFASGSEYRIKPEPREVFIVEKGGLLTLECHSQFSHCCRSGERLVHFREVI